LSLLLVIMGGQHDGLFLSGSPPILYIYVHMYIFLMANKLCCCWPILQRTGLGLDQSDETHERARYIQYQLRYDSVYLTCSKKLTGSELSLPHGINRKIKCETHWVTVPSPLLAQEFETICHPHYDKLFPLLLPKNSWSLICIVLRLTANLKITLGFHFLYFIVVMRSRPLFLCMLCTTNLIWFDLI